VTGGVQVGQVVDDVFARGRGVCFGTSAHGQVFTKNANKFALSATTNPRNNANQWTSGYTSRTVANNPTVDAIFKNSPTKTQAGTTQPDAWKPSAGAGRTTNWEEHRLRLPTPPTTHRAPLKSLRDQCRQDRRAYLQEYRFKHGSLRGTPGVAPFAVRKTGGW
jgi:hypothetical protein